MKRTLRAVGLAAFGLTWSALATAQPAADHLECYKVKDPQAKKTYTADLGGLAAEPGCKIGVPAQMACVPATKTNVTPTPPGGGGTGTPNSFFCYKVKCPKATLPTLAGTDQFGSRTIIPKTASLLCAPLAGPPTTTTTMPRFVDNGDATVTDHQTGLIWEKKVAGDCSVCQVGVACPCTTDTDCSAGTCVGGCLHCVNDTYTWSSSGTAPDGTAFTNFLSTLNGGRTGVGNCQVDPSRNITGDFNGHCDWRLPTIAELETLKDPGAPGCGSGSPCVDPIFGPTSASLYYWSSSSIATAGGQAWSAHFGDGGMGMVGTQDKTQSRFVRAVRGGS